MRNDEAFLEVVSQGGLPHFLDAMFDFLGRRTDFYHVMKKPDDESGFPPGRIEAMVMHSLEKQKTKHSDRVAGANCVEKRVDLPPGAQTRSPSSFSEYNGGCTENYSWNQNWTDVNLLLCPPAQAKEVEVTIRRTSLCILVRGQVLLDGQLSSHVDPDGSSWWVEDKRVYVTLAKVEEAWWPSVLTTDMQTDFSKLESTKPLQDCDAQTQRTIRELARDYKEPVDLNLQ
ncbi:MAG: uncharacterized protein KVP18_005209 [Porospora cf. gigantea A]|uniref:uncharacterized protein n=1 Tax=Porospora cf. gigantea A TaxID=2853593 RepID=UPI0035596444|nr:MAG: hypothetical protein KVP18_005209 [Porospora cf. gigantea A]